MPVQTPIFLGAPYEFWVGTDVPLGTNVGQLKITEDAAAENSLNFDLLHSYHEGGNISCTNFVWTSTILTSILRILRFSSLSRYMVDAICNSNVGVCYFQTLSLYKHDIFYRYSPIRSRGKDRYNHSHWQPYQIPTQSVWVWRCGDWWQESESTRQCDGSCCW